MNVIFDVAKNIFMYVRKGPLTLFSVFKKSSIRLNSSGGTQTCE